MAKKEKKQVGEEKVTKEKKDKKDKKDGKEKDKKKGVTFVHERLTEPPPPRYQVGQEPPLPPWPITWTPIAICLESSIPGLSIGLLTETFNKLARPGMSMAVVHPKDLAEDEMAIDGTVLAEMLQKAKEESNVGWPSSNLLNNCLKCKAANSLLLGSLIGGTEKQGHDVFAARAVLDRNNEHRNEEVRRANTVVEAKHAIEDLKAQLEMAKEGVTAAELKLKDYKAKLLEEKWARKAEKRHALKAVNKVDATEVGENELSAGPTEQNKSKVKEKEQKESKEGRKEDRDKQKGKSEKGKKGKAGKDGPEPEPTPAPTLSPQDQFKLFEEEFTRAKKLVEEVEAKLLKSIENEASLVSALPEPFTMGRLYCILGMESALSVIQLACEDKSFFKAVFNVAPKPKDSTISPEIEIPSKARDDGASTEGLAPSSKGASKKAAKLAKKEAKAAAVATAIPPLVAEIRAVVENGGMMEPARSISVVDVFYEMPPSPDDSIVTREYNEDGDGLKKQEKVAKDKKGKKGRAEKEEQEEVGNKGNEKVEKKGKKHEETKRALSARDESLPYEQIGQAVILAFRRLLLQVQLYNDMGGDKVRIFKIPEAKPIQEAERSYYNNLLDEFPRGLVTVPVIMHCLLEQVAAYDWPVEDIKAIETANMNNLVRNGIYHEFEKLGHPRWVGIRRDAAEGLETRFEKLYNFAQMKDDVTLPAVGPDNNLVFSGGEHQERMADGAILNPRGDKLVSSTNGVCDLHGLFQTGTCAIHKSHIDAEDELTIRTGRAADAPYDPFVQAKELEESLSVTHEFDTLTKFSTAFKAQDLELIDSIDATKVGQHMSMLRATPARWRYKMPGIPEYSEEKMGASLTALQDLCDHYEGDQPKFQNLKDALFQCKDVGQTKLQVDINTMQRYKKLTTFLDMIKEDKDVFPDLDIPLEEIPEGEPEIVIREPYDFDEVKYWCNNCLSIFQHPEITEGKPKQPLTDKERAQLKKEFEMKLVNDYEKRQLAKDPYPEQRGGELQSVREDAFEQEMIEAGIFSVKGKEEKEVKDTESTRSKLDPGVVKMWCAGCQSVFMPPPPPSLEEIWKEGERMRQETERLKAREAQAVVDAKIEAYKRLEQKIRNSILGRRHAEGFADGLMGEVYARAKLNLPFEMVRYDHDEDCILACLYAADAQRNVQEQIPCLMPFGDFCASYDIASGEPIKKRNEVYGMEPQYKLVLDERRYLLTEQQCLVTCGLPAKTPVQYEPRVTIYKDGNIIMLRATKTECKSGKVQEEIEIETGSESGSEGEKNRKEKGDIPAATGKKEKRVPTLEKDANRKQKARKGKEDKDTVDRTSDLVQEPINRGDLASEKQGLIGGDSLPPGLLESEKSVIACLRDGLIAAFFFAKDATLHLQINIPAGGRTFEITSTGVVIFLPSDTQKQEAGPAMDISAFPPALAVESTENLTKAEKPLPKELIIGDKSKQKKGEDDAGKDGAPKLKSKKKNEKVALEKPEKEEKGNKPKKRIEGKFGEGGPHSPLDDSDDPDRGDEEGKLSNDLEFISRLYKKGIEDVEVSRCILPSGTVLSYTQNGFLRVLCNNGNVSEYKTICGETTGWVTTNNRGFCVLQDPPSTGQQEQDTELEKDSKIQDVKAGRDTKQNDAKKDKEKSNRAKQQKQDGELEKEPKSKDAKAGKDTKQKGGKKDKKVVSFAELDDYGLSTENLAASDPNLPLVEVARPHQQLPSKKVVEIHDPDSGSSITTREDLVVVMNTNDKTVHVVQHADGTHIYSEVKEKIEEYKPSVGQISLEKTKEFTQNTGALHLHMTRSTTTDFPSPSIKSKMESDLSTIKTGGVHITAENESVSAPELGSFEPYKSQEIASGTQPANQGFDENGKKRFYSAQWHVRKEGFPHVHGNTSGGVAVEFTTTDGQYCVTWSRETGQISLLMPNHNLIYSCGKSVYFDGSDGTKKSDPKQSLQHQLVDGPFINTNGVYEFNLERANLTFTDNSGSGFRSSWGYKVECITNGLLLRPSETKEKLDPLSEVSESQDAEKMPPNALTPKRPILVDGKKMASQKTATSMINSEVRAAISNNNEASANAAGRSKPLKVQPNQSSQVGLPLSPIAEISTFDSDPWLTMSDPGPVSENSTTAQQSFVSASEGTGDANKDPILGPTARLFVLHEGGFGFEIIHENEFKKYTSSKKFNKDCAHVREVYEEVSAVLHTFVTVKEKAKRLADLELEAQEGCRAPDNFKLWTRKVPEFARRIKLRANGKKTQKRTKCDWLQVNLDLPYLPRVLAPELLPVLPLSNETNVVFRQIFEYPSFEDDQIPRMERILESYYTWQENAMILTDVEQFPDTRTAEEIKKAEAVSGTIREVPAEKKLQEARDRATVEVQHATEIFRDMMDIEAKRLQKIEESMNNMRRKGERDWLQYKESKKGPLSCLHRPCNHLQTNGPYRPSTHVRLCYFKCEEGLQYIVSLQYQERLPEDPRRWSMEALPPFSYSYQGSSASQGSSEHDGLTNAYQIPRITPHLEEEVVAKEPSCLLSQWMKELEMKEDIDEDDGEEKMCWELIKPERKRLGPADWTPCFLEGFDKNQQEEPEAQKIIHSQKIKEAQHHPVVKEIVDEPYVDAEEIGAEIPLPVLPPFRDIPTGQEWEINHEAVQRQLELLPNYPGWRKAQWHKNKSYLDVNLETLHRANISSIGTLHKRPQPPRDWSHQFLVVPDFLDFGTVAYGTISMKVLFLQNYHGTEPGRFRFDNLGPNIKFQCELGMVPPGLSRSVRIFFHASALGCFSHEIRIVTQYDVFCCPIFAEVVKP